MCLHDLDFGFHFDFKIAKSKGGDLDFDFQIDTKTSLHPLFYWESEMRTIDIIMGNLAGKEEKWKNRKVEK